MRDELWFIDFGRGAALPLTPEETPADGEPVVPCAQGRVVIETVRPAPPHFATCSTYRKHITNVNNISRIKQAASVDENRGDKGISPKTTVTVAVTTITATTTAQNIVTRPEDLQIKSCLSNNSTEASPSVTEEQSSNPLLTFDDKIIKPELISTRNSSVESENSKFGINIQRKAYMDLRDAIALLDETCPNPDPSPSITPRTPRTPLTPHPRNKRARSKSSDNSSNYSTDRLSEKSETTKPQEKSKKRPFLRKIGISMTEERPFLSKLAPKIIGKPYLEKIGPSKAVEKPFLDKIGSSKTLEKFTFELPKNETSTEKIIEENEKYETAQKKEEIKPFSKRSGKGFLLKMYSFETEDLEDSSVKKCHGDPLRGASLDDVLDKGSNSLPCMENVDNDGTREPYVVELVKCKVMMSEEVLSSSTCLSSSVEGPMWENSPRRKRKTKKFLSECISKKDTFTSKEGLRSDESVPNSPTKRHLSTIDIDNVKLSPTKSRRQTSEDILDKKSERHKDFDKYSGSSENLFTIQPKNLSLAHVKYDDNKSPQSQESSLIRTSNHNISKETFKQLYNKFESQEVPTESYAEFKQRTRGNLYLSSTLRRMADMQKISTPSQNLQCSSKEIKLDDNEQFKNHSVKLEAELQIRSRSVLQKQDGIDHASDQECDNNTTTFNKPKKRILHEPSQETVDLLTELRKVKSLLKTPSFEKDLDFDEAKNSIKQPKKILLTDKEFCLSVERENSIRRPPKTFNQDLIPSPNTPVLGPAFFEKRCLSLDYADDEKSQKSDIRTISLSSTKCRPSEVEETSESTPICDSKSYCSDVFTSPSEEQISCEKKQENYIFSLHNYNSEIDISIPIDDRSDGHLKNNVQNQSRTTDQYEIMSPRVTPFKIKKRLGKISVEDTMKQESFALNKANCRSVAMQKKTKCFPL